MQKKNNLFRKENTKARGGSHFLGGDYKHQRNTKQEQQSEQTRGKMQGKKDRGLDYTPLFRFLLSNIGKNWDLLYSEIIPRLDRKDPIFWMVSLQEKDKKDWVRIGESSFYSGLFVDENQTLQKVNPNIDENTLPPFCRCCTHTFNGILFTQKYITPNE